MPLDEPSWWYGGRSNDWRRHALKPLSHLYGWAAVRRFAKAQPFRAGVPVICVGNFTAGGTGKTPMSLLLAEMLIALGQTPAFLSRGYSGSMKGPAWVDPAVHDAGHVGDEPLLLAAAAPTMVSRDRVAGINAITAHLPRPSVVVMDDGLQNPALEKDLCLAVVDGVRGIGNGQLIPAGPLRAPLSFQLEMTDAIIVNCPPAKSTDDAESDGVLARLRREFPSPVLAASPEPAGDVSWLEGTKVIAFAGIANPQRFFRLIESLGGELVEALEYRDHHHFTDAEAADLIERARSAGAQLVTTEKDLVRLQEAGATARLRAEARALPIRLKFEDNGHTRMLALLAALFTSRNGTSPT